MEKRFAIWDLENMRVSIPINQNIKDAYLKWDEKIIWTLRIKEDVRQSLKGKEGV